MIECRACKFWSALASRYVEDADVILCRCECPDSENHEGYTPPSAGCDSGVEGLPSVAALTQHWFPDRVQLMKERLRDG